MDIRLPNSLFKKRLASAPKAGGPKSAKPAHLRPFWAFYPGQCWPGHWPGQPGPPVREQGSIHCPSGSELGAPLNVSEAAELIGCSPWTVRQTLIPRGLPHFRFKASGRLIFYRDQVIRWIEYQQQGGNNK